MTEVQSVLAAWPVLIFATISAFLPTFVVALYQRSLTGIGLCLLCTLSIGLLGGIVGYITGLSRVGVAGQLVAAALSFAGVGTAYTFLISEPRSAVLAAAASIAFALSVGTTTLYGASVRSAGDFATELRQEQWQLFNLHAEYCLSFILSEHFPPLDEREKVRVRAYCQDYVEFLQ